MTTTTANPIRIQTSTNTFEATIFFSTTDERAAFVALFPKATKVFPMWAVSGSGPDVPMARFAVTTAPTGVTGAANEAGIKRIRRFVALAAKHGYTFDYSSPFANAAAPTLDQYLAELAS